MANKKHEEGKKMFDMMPWKKTAGKELSNFRREMDDLFERFFNVDFPLSSAFAREGRWNPRVVPQYRPGMMTHHNQRKRTRMETGMQLPTWISRTFPQPPLLLLLCCGEISVQAFVIYNSQQTKRQRKQIDQRAD